MQSIHRKDASARLHLMHQAFNPCSANSELMVSDPSHTLVYTCNFTLAALIQEKQKRTFESGFSSRACKLITAISSSVIGGANFRR